MSYQLYLRKSLLENQIIKVDREDWDIGKMDIEEILPDTKYKIPLTGLIIEFNPVSDKKEIMEVFITEPNEEKQKIATCFNVDNKWVCKSENSKEDRVGNTLLQSAIGVLVADGLI